MYLCLQQTEISQNKDNNRSVKLCVVSVMICFSVDILKCPVHINTHPAITLNTNRCQRNTRHFPGNMILSYSFQKSLRYTHYHQQLPFEQFRTLHYTHNQDGQYPTKPGFEFDTSKPRIPTYHPAYVNQTINQPRKHYV